MVEIKDSKKAIIPKKNDNYLEYHNGEQVVREVTRYFEGTSFKVYLFEHENFETPWVDYKTLANLYGVTESTIKKHFINHNQEIEKFSTREKISRLDQKLRFSNLFNEKACYLFGMFVKSQKAQEWREKAIEIIFRFQHGTLLVKDDVPEDLDSYDSIRLMIRNVQTMNNAMIKLLDKQDALESQTNEKLNDHEFRLTELEKNLLSQFFLRLPVISSHYLSHHS